MGFEVGLGWPGHGYVMAADCLYSRYYSGVGMSYARQFRQRNHQNKLQQSTK